MKEVILKGLPVRINDEGLISLTDMWKASGGHNSKKPNLFLENAQTKRFIKVFPKAGNPALRVIKGGRTPGTWGHKKLAYKFASWIDPEFEHGVYDVLDKYYMGELVLPQQELHDYVIEMRISEELGSFHGRGLCKRRWEKPLLEEKGISLKNKYQLQIEFFPKKLTNKKD